MDHTKIDKVLAILETGESLRKACEVVRLAPSTFLGWVEKNEALAEQYARARGRGADLEFDRLNEAAAEPPQYTDKGSVDAGWVAWKRLQIDTMKWTLAKKRPERYGEKIDITSKGDKVGLAININLEKDAAA